MLSYLHWQFVSTPVWLITLAWNVQHMLTRFFSVSVMVRTLFSHWHKDMASYRMGGIDAIVLAFAWNQISRGIGFIVRTTALIAWMITAALTLTVSIAVIITFLLLPFIITAGIIWGIIGL